MNARKSIVFSDSIGFRKVSTISEYHVRPHVIKSLTARAVETWGTASSIHSMVLPSGLCVTVDTWTYENKLSGRYVRIYFG